MRDPKIRDFAQGKNFGNEIVSERVIVQITPQRQRSQGSELPS